MSLSGARRMEPRDGSAIVSAGGRPTSELLVSVSATSQAPTDLAVFGDEERSRDPKSGLDPPIEKAQHADLDIQQGASRGVFSMEENRSAAPRLVDSPMPYQITLRYGGRRQRYHTFVVEAEDAAEALRAAAEAIPAEIAADVDLVELRTAVDPEERQYLE